MRGSWDSESRASAASESAHHSVVAGVLQAVWPVIRATKAVVAANEMTSSTAKVISVHARHVTSAKTSDAATAEAAHVPSAEATDVTSAKAAHVASATTTMSSTAAAAGLCIGGKKGAGKHCACQNHHHSSSHDILLWMGGTFPPQGLVRRRCVQEGKRQRRDGLKMAMLVCPLY